MFTNLVTFASTNGGWPMGTLVQGRDGNFYGATQEGGTSGNGTVFMMTPQGVLTTLASFGLTNGAHPHAGLILGADGNFYGTTTAGGQFGGGTVFQVTPGGVITSLASFAGTNGWSPEAELVQGTDGNFYGTTSAGGPYNPQYSSGYGTVFQVTPDGTLTTLFSFNNVGPGGYWPWCPLVQGSDGGFYGTTRGGAATLFRIDSTGAFTVLATFDGTNGLGSMFGLIQGVDGNFYGTSLCGTNLDTSGTPLGNVFQATPGGALTCVYSFNGTNGSLPRAMMQASDGNFYGLTGVGGPDFVGPLWTGQEIGHGTVFRLTPNGVLTNLVCFNGTNGDIPFGGLLQAADGNLYGMTMMGGVSGSGTIFRLSVPMPPLLQSVSQTDSGVALSWSAVAGQSYQVQYTAGLDQTNWVSVGSPCTATNGTATACDAIGPDDQRFYRVVLLP
jgi:uncharacterized repeat protein (TIGR03803 family)